MTPQEMEFLQLEIPGAYVIRPVRHGDKRGYFCETFRKDLFDAAVGKIEFVQDNESCSSYGVVRGLHFQTGEYAQSKLVRVTAGKVLDVAVDIRPASPTFGRHLAVELDAEEGLQLFLPCGMAHGYAVLSDMAQFQYKVDNVYAPLHEGSIRFDDPALGIDWRVPSGKMLLSPKDLSARSWAEFVGEIERLPR